MSQEAGTCGIPKFCFFLWDIIFMSGVTGYASHSGAWSGFQWVISPLSGHVYSVLASRGGQSRNSALHRIELQTSRFTMQRLAPLKPSGLWNYRPIHSKYSKDARRHSYSTVGRCNFKIISELWKKIIHIDLRDFVLSVLWLWCYPRDLMMTHRDHPYLL